MCKNRHSLLEFGSVETNSDVPCFFVEQGAHHANPRIDDQQGHEGIEPRHPLAEAAKVVARGNGGYGEAASSGDEAKKKEADKMLKNTADMCGVKHDTVKNGLKKAGIK